MKKLFSNPWFTVFYILVLSSLALGLALYDSFDVVVETITKVNISSLFVMAIWGLLPYITHGLILKLMASHVMPKYRLIDGVENALIGGFMSGITPSSTGGQLAQSYTFKKQGLSGSHGAGIIWLDYFLYTITLVVIALLLFFSNFTKFAHSSITLVFGLGLLVNIIIIVLLGLMVFKPNVYRKLMHFIIHITEKFKWVKQKEKIIHAWDQVLDHFYQAQTVVTENRGVLWELLGLNALKILIYFSTPIIIGLLLHLEIKWSMVIELIALASFVTISNTFVPLPGAAGATESLFVLTFSTVIGKSSAASIMILWRFFSFYLILIIGGILFFKVRHQKAKEIQDEEINYY